MSRKQFYTERDIEDMVAQGKTSLSLSDNVVLTDLARERADKLGLKLIRSDQAAPAAKTLTSFTPPAVTNPGSTSLTTAIKTAVRAKVGNSVSETMLDAIIAQVLAKLNDKGGNY